MITIDNHCFVLETDRTAYAFDVSDGLLRHLYYGGKLRRLEDYAGAAPRPLFAPGNAAVLEGGVSLEDMAQECGSVGWGDVRESLVDVELPDGGRAALFRFAYYERGVSAQPCGLPAAIGGGDTLKVVLQEQRCQLYLELYYTVFEKCDAIDVGEVGIFVVNGDAYIKELGNKCLISHNPAYKPIKLGSSDSVYCCGRVLGVVED